MISHKEHYIIEVNSGKYNLPPEVSLQFKLDEWGYFISYSHIGKQYIIRLEDDEYDEIYEEYKNL